VLATLLVPALLALLGERINKWSVRRGSSVSKESDGWYRLARGVMRRPVLVALACTALLLAAASPLFGTVLTRPSAPPVPPNQPSYAANAAIDKSYGRAVTEAITIAVKGRADDASLAALDQRIQATPGIAGGQPFVRASADVAFANFAPASVALSQRSQDAV